MTRRRTTHALEDKANQKVRFAGKEQRMEILEQTDGGACEGGRRLMVGQTRWDEAIPTVVAVSTHARRRRADRGQRPPD